MPARTLDRLQHREFRLPITQHERFRRRNLTPVADAIPLFFGLCGRAVASHKIPEVGQPDFSRSGAIAVEAVAIYRHRPHGSFPSAPFRRGGRAYPAPPSVTSAQISTASQETQTPPATGFPEISEN